MKTCKKCGVDYPDSQKFCGECGEKLSSKENSIEKEQKNQPFTINRVIIICLLALVVVLGVLIFVVFFPYEAITLSYKELGAVGENHWGLSHGCYYVATVVIQSTSDYTGDFKVDFHFVTSKGATMDKSVIQTISPGDTATYTAYYDNACDETVTWNYRITPLKKITIYQKLRKIL